MTVGATTPKASTGRNTAGGHVDASVISLSSWAAARRPPDRFLQWRRSRAESVEQVALGGGIGRIGGHRDGDLLFPGRSETLGQLVEARRACDRDDCLSPPSARAVGWAVRSRICRSPMTGWLASAFRPVSTKRVRLLQPKFCSAQTMGFADLILPIRCRGLQSAHIPCDQLRASNRRDRYAAQISGCSELPATGRDPRHGVAGCD